MRLVLHIGSPKAGSTSIQTALATHRETLHQHGILFVQGEYDFAALYQNFGTVPPPLAARFPGVPAIRSWSESRLQDLEARIDTERPEIVLLSSEHFLNLGGLNPFLQRLRERFDDITAIAYIRDPVSAFPSQINQRIRGGAKLQNLFSPWDLSNPMWQADALRRWEAELGTTALRVRNFERVNLRNGDVVQDFLHVLSEVAGSLPDLPDRAFATNESLSGASAAWLLMLNESRLENLAPKRRKQVFSMRQALIQDLRLCEDRLNMPSLKLRDEVIIGHIRHATGPGSAFVNARFLAGQVQLSEGDASSSPVDPVELRHRTRDWIMSYLTPEFLAELARENLAVEPEQT